MSNFIHSKILTRLKKTIRGDVEEWELELEYVQKGGMGGVEGGVQQRPKELKQRTKEQDREIRTQDRRVWGSVT